MSNRIHLKITVFGEVQSVFFRVSAKEKVQELGVECFTRNLSDGTVEIIIEGEKEKVSPWPSRQMTEWCKIGPSLAKVKKVEITHLNSLGHSHLDTPCPSDK
jgi:acylphosphatase